MDITTLTAGLVVAGSIAVGCVGFAVGWKMGVKDTKESNPIYKAEFAKAVHAEKTVAPSNVPAAERTRITKARRYVSPRRR